MHIVHILYKNLYFTYNVYYRYLEQCQTVFPYKKGNGHPFMADGKNHSIIHTPTDITRYCDVVNFSCDPPEEAHKTWVKKQGVCTNQGPQVQLSMMLHSLRKEASSLLCEAVQGKCYYSSNIYAFFN